MCVCFLGKDFPFFDIGYLLLFVGKQDKSDATVAALKAIPQPFSSFATVLLEICAYTGLMIVM